MTPAEHYREAERLLGDAGNEELVAKIGEAVEVILAAAQVHATLALAAPDVADPNYHAKRARLGPS